MPCSLPFELRHSLRGILLYLISVRVMSDQETPEESKYKMFQKADSGEEDVYPQNVEKKVDNVNRDDVDQNYERPVK